jgi:hypothetical protein
VLGRSIHLSLSFVILILGVLTICGCVPGALPGQTPKITTDTTATPELVTPTKSLPPTSTSTSQSIFTTPSPTPLIDPTTGFREWLPEPVLIQAGTIHDLKIDPFDRDPSFVLYSNGELIQKKCSAGSCQYLTVNLNTRQVCRLLNTIELYGFFDYDPSRYRTPLAGGEITYIEVTTWRSQRIALYQLEDWLEDPNWLDRLLECVDCRKAPEIKSALSETFWLLKDLKIPGAVVYQPSSLGLWLSEPQLAGDPVDWALSAPSLSRLVGMSQCSSEGQHQAVVLTGSEADSVASYINQVISQGFSPIFEENGAIYQISTRWLLLYERAAGCGESTNQFPSSDIPTATELMSCRLSDGVIPTPTSTWIP